jgi:hypothetical protein
MTPKKFPKDVLDQAVEVQSAWARIDEGLTAGNVNISVLVTQINQLHQVNSTVSDVENQLLEVRTRREDLCVSIWDKVKRMRAVVKGVYGDDSLQYEMVGGTRISDRKTARRAPAPVE